MMIAHQVRCNGLRGAVGPTLWGQVRLRAEDWDRAEDSMMPLYVIAY